MVFLNRLSPLSNKPSKSALKRKSNDTAHFRKSAPFEPRRRQSEGDITRDWRNPLQISRIPSFFERFSLPSSSPSLLYFTPVLHHLVSSAFPSDSFHAPSVPCEGTEGFSRPPAPTHAGLSRGNSQPWSVPLAQLLFPEIIPLRACQSRAPGESVAQWSPILIRELRRGLSDATWDASHGTLSATESGTRRDNEAKLCQSFLLLNEFKDTQWGKCGWQLRGIWFILLKYFK